MGINRKSILAAAVLGALGAHVAYATPYTWDGTDSGNSTNWSDVLNWMGDASAPSATADTITFDNNGTAALNNTVDAGLGTTTFTKLVYQQTDPTQVYTTNVDRGVNLSLLPIATSNSPSFTNSSLVLMPASGATASGPSGTVVKFVSTGTGSNGKLVLSGGGSFSVSVTGRAGSSVITNESYAVLDLSGLDEFTFRTDLGAGSFTNSNFAIGGGSLATGDTGAYSGKVILGAKSTINVNRLSVGGQSVNGSLLSQPVSLLVLGQDNNIDTSLSGNLYVGSDPNTPAKDPSGGVLFRSTGLTNPVLTGGSTTSRMAIQVGRHNGNTGHFAFGEVDGTSASVGSEGTVNLFLTGTTRIGGGPIAGGAGGGAGMVSMDKGIIDTDGSIVLGTSGNNTNAGAIEGYLNVGLKGAGTDTGQGLVTTATNLVVGQRVHTTGGVSTGVLNLANSGAVTADRVFIGDNTTADNGNGATLGIVNLNGGVLTTGQIQGGSDAVQNGTKSTRLLNLNGGTLKVKAGSTRAATFLQGITAANVYSGGATIDTNGVDTTIAQPLVAPAGSGVSSIDVAAGAGGSGYRVAPMVMITPAAGDTGVGATAVARIDATGAVTGITVTNPGTGYAANPTVTLMANGATSVANMALPFGGTAATTTVTLAANASGGIAKNGAGSLKLTGANTYTGVTTINQGDLILTTPAQNAALTGGGADVRAGHLIFDYTGGSTPAASVQTALASHKLTTSTGSSSIGLGWQDNAGASQVVVQRALFGDTDLNNTVDLTDFTFLAGNFNGTGKNWQQGDFDYNGTVDLTDFTYLAGNFNATLPADAVAGGVGSPVPEPTSLMALATLAGAALARRRVRRR